MNALKACLSREWQHQKTQCHETFQFLAAEKVHFETYQELKTATKIKYNCVLIKCYFEVNYSLFKILIKQILSELDFDFDLSNSTFIEFFPKVEQDCAKKMSQIIFTSNSPFINVDDWLISMQIKRSRLNKLIKIHNRNITYIILMQKK